MTDNTRKSAAERKRAAKKTAIRVICLILALSMVITTIYMLYIYLVSALS